MLTSKQLADIFDDERENGNHSDEFLKFNRIPEAERRHARRDLCGMLLLAERMPGTRDIVQGADHDQIWFDCKREKYDSPWPLTEEDAIYLMRCGFFWDEKNESLSSFV